VVLVDGSHWGREVGPMAQIRVEFVGLERAVRDFQKRELGPELPSPERLPDILERLLEVVKGTLKLRDVSD
jgi:hypothetical protein